MKVRVFVPATSANLGSGFDVLGLAVSLYNEFCVEDAEKFEIRFLNGRGKLPNGKDNLFYESFEKLFKVTGTPVPTVKISMNLQVRQGRGFGSSATAVVGGLIAANAFLGNRFTRDQLLRWAVELERGQHPDNVAPALFGGLIVSAKNGSGFVQLKVPVPPEMRAVFFIPDFIMDTVASRNLMPTSYSKEDTVFSTSRVALFLTALQTKRYDLLRIAMEDRIHQPTRGKLFPAMQEFINAANFAGAFGTALSGSGSAIISFCGQDFTQVGNAMVEVAQKHSITGVLRMLDIVNEGAMVSCDEVIGGEDQALFNYSEDYLKSVFTRTQSNKTKVVS